MNAFTFKESLTTFFSFLKKKAQKRISSYGKHKSTYLSDIPCAGYVACKRWPWSVWQACTVMLCSLKAWRAGKKEVSWHLSVYFPSKKQIQKTKRDIFFFSILSLTIIATNWKVAYIKRNIIPLKVWIQ